MDNTFLVVKEFENNLTTGYAKSKDIDDMWTNDADGFTKDRISQHTLNLRFSRGQDLDGNPLYEAISEAEVDLIYIEELLDAEGRTADIYYIDDNSTSDSNAGLAIPQSGGNYALTINNSSGYQAYTSGTYGDEKTFNAFAASLKIGDLLKIRNVYKASGDNAQYWYFTVVEVTKNVVDNNTTYSIKLRRKPLTFTTSTAPAAIPDTDYYAVQSKNLLISGIFAGATPAIGDIITQSTNTYKVLSTHPYSSTESDYYDGTNKYQFKVVQIESN